MTLLTFTVNRHDRLYSVNYFLVLNFRRLELTFDGDIMNAVACNLESRGFKALCKATKEIVGYVEPYSITGSLPLIRELQVWETSNAHIFFWMQTVY